MSPQKLRLVIAEGTPRIIEEVRGAVRAEPYLRTYHAQTDNELLNRFLDVSQNLNQWLEVKNDELLRNRYRELARQRLRQEVPLSEVVLAAQTFERVLIDHLRKRTSEEQPAVGYETEALVREFFNQVVFSMAVAYEIRLLRALI